MIKCIKNQLKSSLKTIYGTALMAGLMLSLKRCVLTITFKAKTHKNE